MANELVNAATSEKLTEMDWTKSIEICELVAQDPRQAKDVTKAIKKRLGNKNTNTQLYSVMLLEMLMNNIGENVHKQVIDSGILPILVKIVKKKSDLPVRERIFLLLDAMQTSLGGASGKFPQYYNAYYELVNAGVQFSQTPRTVPSNQTSAPTNTSNNPDGVVTDSRHEAIAQQVEPQNIPESSIIQKASNALEVLKEVLDAVDPQNPEGAKDEFTLDLVEQCSFQKQRVMHLVMTSRNEEVVSKAIELNEQLEQVLSRHDSLLSGKTTSTANHSSQNHTVTAPVKPQPNAGSFSDELEEEEEAEQLFRRIRKGKAHARPEDEEGFDQRAFSVPSDKLNRPLIRPVNLEAPHKPETHMAPRPVNSEAPHKPETHVMPRPPSLEQSHEPDADPVPVVIPPPPARHVEREKFFRENKVDSSAVAGHVRGLSLHSRNGSSSRSGSMDFSD